MRVGLLLLAILGCAHATPPAYNRSAEAEPGQFGKTEFARLSAGPNDYIRSYKYQVPSAGIMRATLQSATARGGMVSLAISKEGTDVPIATADSAGIAEARITEPGAYYVSVSEPYNGAISLEVYFDVTFAPAK